MGSCFNKIILGKERGIEMLGTYEDSKLKKKGVRFAILRFTKSPKKWFFLAGKMNLY